MSDNEILSDEELASIKASAEGCQGDIFRLVLRLERAESEVKKLGAVVVTASEQTSKLLAVTGKVARERDQALKCLAEAPPCGEYDAVDALDYFDWYHSPARQNLLKGVK